MGSKTNQLRLCQRSCRQGQVGCRQSYLNDRLRTKGAALEANVMLRRRLAKPGAQSRCGPQDRDKAHKKRQRAIDC